MNGCGAGQLCNETIGISAPKLGENELCTSQGPTKISALPVQMLYYSNRLCCGD